MPENLQFTIKTKLNLHFILSQTVVIKINLLYEINRVIVFTCNPDPKTVSTLKKTIFDNCFISVHCALLNFNEYISFKQSVCQSGMHADQNRRVRCV